MIFCNIKMNENKLEEFVRVLLPEYYDILDETSKKKVYINVTEKNNIIKVETVLKDNTFPEKGHDRGKINFQYKKIGLTYNDQQEVMVKVSLLKLFDKENDYKWGALIGVRPTKIVRRFLDMGLSYKEIEDILKNVYLVNDEKSKLLLEIVKRQQSYLDRKTAGIYIGIAYCPTKCTYCSFPAYLLKGKYAERYDEYFETLIKEIKETLKMVRELGIKISIIYIGGGTPSILSEREIEILLGTIKENYDFNDLKEFTFEAGRIDTLNEEKLKIIKKYEVNKISINPQSFNDKTLKLVNRYHNKEEFDKVYNIAKKLNLKINMDLIFGLPGETTEDILYTLEKVKKYNPENFTIHNLAIKNASKLNKENYKHGNKLNYEKIFEKLNEITTEKNLYPYYMYRQKNSFHWGENLGYSLLGCESIYNIEMIEENKVIIGIGAGAITKLIWKDNGKDNIKRFINPKDPLVWINEVEERLENKKQELKKLYCFREDNK
ncbi:coproporphyrinogen III oxidase [Leptotrichia sp. OH3620_COT-345]|uniref:coproporphyrinogen III oxidase n=1 Tax=Leptotrichia sp. OH3620_COT-345 TaxID=2491048 RepID=UPI000F651181|nr:coproporphyrinogen III oxidase [Leptotrichia sp. OH3620_COT-345]RRD38267.1 coproporphyrinogen III oxidase [Leptotrichia sp. OH3620_COT-345]